MDKFLTWALCISVVLAMFGMAEASRRRGRVQTVAAATTTTSAASTTTTTVGGPPIRRRYVDPDAVGGTYNGLTEATAYQTLSAAETAEQGDITAATGSNERVEFVCFSSGVTHDTTIADFAGWTTSGANYVSVTAATDDRYKGATYSGAKYVFAVTNTYGIRSDIDFFRMDGIQIKAETSGGNAYAIYANIVATANYHRYSNMLFWCSDCTGTARAYGIRNAEPNLNADIYNNVFSDFVSGTDADFLGIITDGNEINIWNNTFYNNFYGVLENGSGTYNLTNNASFGNAEVGSADFSGTYNSITYCATDDSYGGTGNFQITQTASNYAALVTDAPGGDFSITDASSALQNMGTDSVTPTDVTGSPRISPHDIGAFELQ